MLLAGHIYSFDLFNGETDLLNPFEIVTQLTLIMQSASEQSKGRGLAALTTTNRDRWSRNRTLLEDQSSKNVEFLKIIDEAMFVISFDDSEPINEVEHLQAAMSGDVINRWMDKMSVVSFKNGRLTANFDVSSRTSRN